MALTKMTQVELVNELVEETGLSRADVKRVLEALEQAVVSNLQACIRTTVAGVTIEPKLRAATKKRMGRNPQTGEDVQISAKPASVRVAARIAKKLKEQAPSVGKLKANL